MAQVRGLYGCGDSGNPADSAGFTRSAGMGTEVAGSTAGMEPRHAGIPWAWNLLLREIRKCLDSFGKDYKSDTLPR